MTYKEAYNDLLGNTSGDECQCHLYTYELALKALAKQIPKKTRKVVDEYFIKFKCPTCGHGLLTNLDGEIDIGMKYTYCNVCGQAIDWSESK